MIKKTIKIIIFIFSFFILTSTNNICLAIGEEDSSSSEPVTMGSTIGDQTDSFTETAGFSTTMEFEDIVATIIKVVLSLLGIIFVALMIFGGYQWMTAGGNEDTIKKAKSRITSAIIGLVIVLFAYGITAFIFNNLPSNVTGNSGTIPIQTDMGSNIK
jgi:hypothetical protein